MTKEQRLLYIIKALKKSGKVRVKELASHLSVTERTIRRDLNYLKQQDIADVFYGGARSLIKSENILFEKKYVWSKASMFVNDNAGSEKRALKGNVFVFGSFNTDLVYAMNDFPKAGETVHANGFYCSTGGKGSNQAIAAAAAGAKTTLLVKVGKDDFGVKAKHHLKSTNISALSVLESDDYATGSAIVMLSRTGENSIIIDLAANTDFSQDDIEMHYPLIKETDVFLAQLENNFSATKLAVKYAKKANKVVIVNPAPYSSEITSILKYVDILTPNQSEAESITGIDIVDEASTRQAAEKIHDLGVGQVIITLGAEGCWYFDGKNHTFLKSFKAISVDTSGAGDAFNGALAASLAQGNSMMQAITFASAFASLAVERKGASNMPDLTSVKMRMNGNL